MESFGEDVLINSNMGANICKGLEQNGVIATPKHYVDNYSYGGRDSHVSDSSERHLREVYLKPFEKCVKEGGAHSIMPAYNSWEGIPCSCNKKLLEDILRGEWGFEGFAVSDYGGVDGICWVHHLEETFGNEVEFIFAPDSQIEEVASECDVAIYFTTTVEGEGMDRSDIRLPSVMEAKQEDDNAIIVGKVSMSVEANQEESIQKMAQVNANSIVVLLTGAPVDMSAWEGGCKGILEAWYPGEQGARALSEILFGQISPSGKLPISVPRNVGQVPIFYAMKPSGRGYGYNENDGTPLYPFGFGLSYTSFSFSELCFTQEKERVKITFVIENVGTYDGDEVIQVYVSGKNCDVVLPLKELKAYKRVHLQKGEKQKVVINLPEEAFYYYDSEMNYGLHRGNFTITVGTSCTDCVGEYQIKY